MEIVEVMGTTPTYGVAMIHFPSCAKKQVIKEIAITKPVQQLVAEEAQAIGLIVNVVKLVGRVHFI